MNIEPPLRGSLLPGDFLLETITETPEWRRFDAAAFALFENDLRGVFAQFPTGSAPNETQTEDDLIWPILARLGWTDWLRQQNLSARGREDVPDGLLFADAAAKARANGFSRQWKRYEFGSAIVETKRWGRPLDRRSDLGGEETAPSTQMLRYLRRVDDLTAGKLRWGILANGARWRLYWQGSRSVSEQFLEADLAALLGFSGALNEAERRHGLKAFATLFRREAFLPGAEDERTFLRRAVEEGRFHRERVAADLSSVVFDEVFPELAGAIAANVPDAPLSEVRDAALVFLYRLLFILYAEDRDLLPVRDSRYDDYALRDKVRGDVGRRKDAGDVFSETAARYWSAIDDLCRAIDRGDASIGLPPYNGGLFDRGRTPLLARVRLGDRPMADIIDALSFRRTAQGERRYINYRDLGVQQLGSIYERLLEREIGREGDTVVVQPNRFTRKDWGSYYTPDDLVGLIVTETLDPLAQRFLDAFRARVSELEKSRLSDERKRMLLADFDPAEALATLKVCDPAMGSGHFLVSLVDDLTDRIVAAMAEAHGAVAGYVSPLAARVESVRETILGNADRRAWAIDPARLDDRHVVRRMVLKRCVYGVDRNPMAVELAKVALWLHTFTAGAPLSFLDHHLRCGDSLFGAWVRGGIDKAAAHGAPLLLHAALRRAMGAERAMNTVENHTDAEMEEASLSAEAYETVRDRTVPLDRFLTLVHALEWLDIRDERDRAALRAFFDGQFGNPVAIASGDAEVSEDGQSAERFADILRRARRFAGERRFFNWQVAFPGVWSNWRSDAREGGFDAVIGNPPWERVRVEPVEWFASRRRDVALAPRAADRKRLVAALRERGDPLAAEFDAAKREADAALRVARNGGDYPLLSGGDVNCYSLFVERAMTLVKPGGMVGMLTPSGIAAEKTAARFFKSVATEGRLKSLYDFENRKIFFPDVHASFKFCVFVASTSPLDKPAECAFFLRDLSELEDPERRFTMAAADFARINPNTGTAPVFRSRSDAQLAAAIYERLPILFDRSSGGERRIWPVDYSTMFHMSGDSSLFRTREELEEKEGAWPIGGNRFDSPMGEWAPLYEGKMVQAYDHRASDIVVKRGNVFRPGQTNPVSSLGKSDPDRLPMSRYWVRVLNKRWRSSSSWVIAFKNITAVTNMRTMIAAVIPRVGAGDTLSLLVIDESAADAARVACAVVANLNASIFDYVARQKVPATHFTLYILEQLPVVPLDRYEKIGFGAKTAGEIVREAVLELTYTARDMGPFAHDLGHIDATGGPPPPFPWDEERRLALRAKLDAVYFHLYGVTDRDEVRYVYSTFPIVERQERKTFGAYRSRDLCLAWMNALAAGRPDGPVEP